MLDLTIVTATALRLRAGAQAQTQAQAQAMAWQRQWTTDPSHSGVEAWRVAGRSMHRFKGGR